jgi:hypothetical protein
MTMEIMALNSAKDVEAWADSLSLCADEIHARVMQALKIMPQSPAPAQLSLGISQPAAQALFEMEVELRQHANSLYADAATLAVVGLETSQQGLLDVTVAAQKSIRKIDRLKGLIDMASSLLMLASAAVTGKPDQMLSALKKIKKNSAALSTGRA